jgi:uncharacterized membrane protein
VTPDKPSTRGRRVSPHLLALWGLPLLTALFYALILAGQRAFPSGDFSDHFLPFSLFQRAELLAGRLPLWNPYTFGGHPFLADTQAAVFYPLSNLLLVLTLPWADPAARLYWLQVEAVLHVALAGWFTYLLASDLVRSRPAAILAGCVFAFSGYLTGYPPLQLAVLRTAIWLPLIFWLVRRAFVRPDGWRWWLAGACAYAVAFLAGHPQTFLFLSYALAGWMLFLWATARAPRGRYAPRIVVFYVLFLALSAAQLWPSLEFTALSVRADVTYAFVSGGFPLRDTAQMLLPGILTQFSPLYVGLVPLGLALLVVALPVLGRRWSGFKVRGSRLNTRRSAVGGQRSAVGGRQPSTFHLPLSTRNPHLFFAALALLALLASFGNHGFLYPILYRWAPGWALFRGQERAAYLMAFALSVLAGYGAAALGGLSRERRRTFGIVLAGLASVGLIALALTLRGAADVIVTDAALLRGMAVGLGILLAGALVMWPEMAGRRRLWLLLGLSVVDLFAANLAVNLALPRPQPPALASAVQAAVRPGFTADGSAPARVHNEGPLFEDYGMIVGVEDLSGSSPLRLARYAALLTDFPRERLWQLTGARYVLSARRDLYVPSQLAAEFPGADGPSYLHRLDAANPRAWVANTVRVVDDAAALPLLGDASFNPERTALLPPPAHEGLEDGTLAPVGADSVRLERISPNRLRAHVTSEHGGLLIVSENWMPGWRASVQRAGEPAPRAAPLLRADLTLLAVPVQPGESTVELTYWPDSVRYGLLISGGAWVLLALAALVQIGKSANRRIGKSANQQIGKSADGRLGQRSAVGCRRSAVLGRRSSVVGRLSALGVVLLAFAARAFRLGYQELRGDEALGRLFSLEPFGEILRSTIALREPHPVASYFVEKLWLGLAGHTEFALRFVSLWFGVLAVAVLYRLGRRLGLGQPVSVLAAALLAVSPYAIWHGQDARMYSMSLALTLASTLLMLEALARRRILVWAAYAGVTWLALHTHYYAAYVIVAQNLFVLGRALWSRDERRNALPWLAAQAATAVLYAPWLIAARATLTGYVGNGDSPGFAAMWLRSLSVFAAGESVPGEQRPLLAVLAAALLLIGAARLMLVGTRGRRALWLLGLYLLVPLLATWLGAQARPIFNERYLVAALPAFFLLVAAAVFAPARDVKAGQPAEVVRRWGHSHWLQGLRSRLARMGMSQPDAVLRIASAALLVLMVSASLLSLGRHYDDPAYSKTRGWRTLASVLARHSAGYASESVRVAQTYPDPTLWYYYTGPAGQLVLPPAPRDAPGAEREVAALVGEGVQRVVVAMQSSPAWDDTGIASAALAKEYALLAETPVAGWKVQVFDRAPAVLGVADIVFAPASGAAAGSGLRLLGASVPAERLLPGDVLRVYLRWAGQAAALSGSEKITLQLLAGSGKLVAQTDQPFDPGVLDASSVGYTVAVPRLLSPGAYRLIVALYDPSRPGAARLLTTSGADHVELAVLPAP